MNRNPNAADIKPVKRVTFSEISYFIISSSTNMSKKIFFTPCRPLQFCTAKLRKRFICKFFRTEKLGAAEEA